MRFKSFRVVNYRSFLDSGLIELSKINVLFGANNAGKSSILYALHSIQELNNHSYFSDVRIGHRESNIQIDLLDTNTCRSWENIHNGYTGEINFRSVTITEDRISGNTTNYLMAQGTNHNVNKIPATEPLNTIVPYYSKRKVSNYNEDIREQHVLSVGNDFHNMSAKLSRLANPAYPGYEAYREACLEILGFIVTSVPSTNGSKPGVFFPEGQSLHIDQMGDGVPNVVHFLCALALSKNKIFLIEEPENDLHPKALKALLNLIIKSSEHNQFVVSTHSNIVVKELCSESDSSLFNIANESKSPPQNSYVMKVGNTPEERLSVLSELGYDLSDLELWDGWLILEEASAERIIRDYLIPWFAPKLSRIRTISAGGTSKVEPNYEDIHRLFVYTYLTPVYQKSCWVVVDGDDSGKEAIDKLKTKFDSNLHTQFINLTRENFEEYYPISFSEEVAKVIAISDRQEKRRRKKELLDVVREWLDTNEEQGKIELAQSCKEVIEILKSIESSLLKKTS